MVAFHLNRQINYFIAKAPSNPLLILLLDTHPVVQNRTNTSTSHWFCKTQISPGKPSSRLSLCKLGVARQQKQAGGQRKLPYHDDTGPAISSLESTLLKHFYNALLYSKGFIIFDSDCQ